MKFSSRLIIAAAFVAQLSFAQNTAYTNAIISLTPLGYWKLDGNFADSAPANKHAGVNGNLASPIGYTLAGGGAPIDPAGQAAVFNSSQAQSVTIAAGEPATGTTFDFSALQPFTLMAWVKTANQGLPTMLVVGKVDSSQTGYALVINNGPPFGPQGSGRFGLLLDSQGNVSEVESAVSVNDGAWHFLVATYDGSGGQSGIQLYLDGAKVATIAAPQNPQVTGSILNNAPLTIGGTLSVASAPAFEGLIDEVAVFGSALTQAQIQQLAGNAATARKILSQFVFGGGWYSAVYFSNSGIAQVSFPVTFTADNGTSMDIPLIGGATTVTLAPGGTAEIEAPNIGFLSQGYASVIPPPGVIGYGVFRQSVPGISDQEAVVPFSGANTTTSTLLFDDTGSLVTTFAIANPNPVAVTVTITVTKSDGSTIGTTTLQLQPDCHTALALRDPSLNLTGVAGNRGTAVFSVTSGNVTVLGLRFDGSAFTSIPTTDR